MSLPALAMCSYIRYIHYIYIQTQHIHIIYCHVLCASAYIYIYTTSVNKITQRRAHFSHVSSEILKGHPMLTQPLTLSIYKHTRLYIYFVQTKVIYVHLTLIHMIAYTRTIYTTFIFVHDTRAYKHRHVCVYIREFVVNVFFLNCKMLC